jgi:hypothetical protein
MRFGPNMTGDNTSTAIGVVMAPRDSNFARETVAGNLGITADDLGVSESDGEGLAGFENTEDGEGSNEDTDFGEGRQQGQVEDEDLDFGESGRPVRRARDQFGREPQARRQQQQQQRQPSPQLPQSGQVQPDARGNLVDGTGQIVARAGKEARLYQYGINATRQLQQLQGQHRTVTSDLTNRLNRAVEIGNELNSRIEASEARNKQITRLGLSEQDHLQAVQLAARAKTDPIGTLKFLLTQAAANGIDVAQLGMQGGADFKTIAEVIRNELQQGMQPLKARTEQEQRQEQERTRETREQQEALGHVKTFFANNPEAQKFVPVFHGVLQNHPGTSLDAIWARIQLNLERQRMQQGDGGRTRQRRGAPNGRGRLPEGQNNNRGRMAPVSQTYEQVTRGVLDELGIK